MNRYHNRFLSSFTAENVIGLFSRYGGAAKEVTESWAMLEAAKKVIPNIGEYYIIVVGDGCSPRTGALFAYFTKAKVLSIDPNFNLDHWKEHVEKQTAMGFPPQRITLIKDKVENLEVDGLGKPVLVVWPHSHADMNSLKLKNYESRVDIAMPCCTPIPKNWMERPHIFYEDFHVMSPKRGIHCWKGKVA